MKMLFLNQPKNEIKFGDLPCKDQNPFLQKLSKKNSQPAWILRFWVLKQLPKFCRQVKNSKKGHLDSLTNHIFRTEMYKILRLDKHWNAALPEGYKEMLKDSVSLEEKN